MAASEHVQKVEGDGATGESPERDHRVRVVEALLFSSNRPVTASRLADLADLTDGREARAIIRELRAGYDAAARAFTVEEIAGGFQILTRPEFALYVRRLESHQQQDSLSRAALETLAIVAYRQPITRAEVEDIRGVQCGSILRSLVDRRLLKVAGKKDEIGRPLLYATTRYFLEAFGLKSLRDLPKHAELKVAEPNSGSADAASQETEPQGPAEA
jgi:segregation and condensation protein B